MTTTTRPRSFPFLRASVAGHESVLPGRGDAAVGLEAICRNLRCNPGPCPPQGRGCGDGHRLSGQGDTFDEAIGDFALAYADQTVRDHAALVAAAKMGTTIETQATYHDPFEKMGGLPGKLPQTGPLRWERRSTGGAAPDALVAVA